MLYTGIIIWLCASLHCVAENMAERVSRERINGYLGAVGEHLGQHRDLVLVQPLPLRVRRDVPLLIESVQHPQSKHPSISARERDYEVVLALLAWSSREARE